MVCALLVPSYLHAEPLRIFAAASLKSALDQVVARYAEDTGQAVTVSYGGSSVIARQIQQGAPADIFFSANLAWMDLLSQEGLIAPGTQANLLGNTLVVIAAPGESELERLQDLPRELRGRRLSMAQIDAVPAGIYGANALRSAGIWEEVSTRVAQSANVRAALALVAAEAVPYGIVYRTDAFAEPRVTVAYSIPPELHAPIIYPVAAVRQSEASSAFLDHLTSKSVIALFAKQGFVPLIGE